MTGTTDLDKVDLIFDSGRRCGRSEAFREAAGITRQWSAIDVETYGRTPADVFDALSVANGGHRHWHRTPADSDPGEGADKLCPFCRGDQLGYDKGDSFLYCLGCGVTGPYGRAGTRTAARSAWNGRRMP